MFFKRVQSAFTILVLACSMALSALAQDYKALLGKWSMTSKTNGDPVKWMLVLKEADGKLTAALASEKGEQPAKDFTYVDGVIKFKAPYNGEYYDVELRSVENKLKGKWQGNGDSGETSGTKL